MRKFAWYASATALTGLFPAVVWAQASPPSISLPTIDVVGVAPVPSGSELARDKIPSNVQTLSSSDFDPAKTPSLLDAMNTGLAGVSLSDQTGNSFQRELNYRGFFAGPVIGTPQGLAVYQNGTRINEVFGDTVNWDFIPEMAINRLTLQPNNPIFGLNAQGGAVSIEMKNGFSYSGAEGLAMFGSFGRRQLAAQTGGGNGTYSAYAAVDGLNDKGWRDFDSFSRVRRMYVDVGARGEQTEFHVSFTGADNTFGAVAATPVELLNQRWSAVYTFPQTTHNRLAFLQANANYKPTDTFSVQGNAYFRGFRQSHVDGNTTEALPCDPGSFPGSLCFDDNTVPLLDSGGNIVPDIFGTSLGQIDRTWTTSNSFGGSLQATSTSQLFGHDNHFVVGMSLDRGRVDFKGNSELGTIDQNLFVTGTGVFIQQPDPTLGPVLAPVLLRSNTTYTGLYATNTFDITSKLALTAGARLNVAQIDLEDQLGTALNSDNRFTRVNPVVGLTYKVTPNATVYAGYSEANRAPTPLELGCSDPVRPCLIDKFLISDPPLKQVVSHTYEAGFRGRFDVGDRNGKLKWNLGIYRIDSDDDIINVASPVAGFGFFVNAGRTQRQGLEAGVAYEEKRWNAYTNYAFVDATFQSPLTLSSPGNPFAAPDPVTGNLVVQVTPGNQIPAIPQHRFKAGVEYSITEPWTIGANINVTGSQYLIGDGSNQNPKVPAYWVVNLHTSYKVTKNIEVFGLVQNLFNKHYYTAGTFFETDAIAFLNLSDPRTFLPGAPLAAYAGIRAKL